MPDVQRTPGNTVSRTRMSGTEDAMTFEEAHVAALQEQLFEANNRLALVSAQAAVHIAELEARIKQLEQPTVDLVNLMKMHAEVAKDK